MKNKRVSQYDKKKLTRLVLEFNGVTLSNKL